MSKRKKWYSTVKEVSVLYGERLLIWIITISILAFFDLACFFLTLHWNLPSIWIPVAAVAVIATIHTGLVLYWRHRNAGTDTGCRMYNCEYNCDGFCNSVTDMWCPDLMEDCPDYLKSDKSLC